MEFGCLAVSLKASYLSFVHLLNLCVVDLIISYVMNAEIIQTCHRHL